MDRSCVRARLTVNSTVCSTKTPFFCVRKLDYDSPDALVRPDPQVWLNSTHQLGPEPPTQKEPVNSWTDLVHNSSDGSFAPFFVLFVPLALSLGSVRLQATAFCVHCKPSILTSVMHHVYTAQCTLTM